MYGTIPPETLAELLLFLNDHEGFDSLKTLGTVSRDALSNAIKALAEKLKSESGVFPEEIQLNELRSIPEKFRKILEQLTPQETKLLLKGLSL